jgi:hypothetical protein
VAARLASAFEVRPGSGGKKGLDLQLLSVKAEGPEPVQLTWRHAVKAEGIKERKEKVIHGHCHESILLKEKLWFDCLNSLLFSDLPYSSAKMLLPL